MGCELPQHGNVLRVSLIAYATQLVAVAVGTFPLSEPFTWRLLAGSILVLCGVFAVVGRPAPSPGGLERAS